MSHKLPKPQIISNQTPSVPDTTFHTLFAKYIVFSQVRDQLLLIENIVSDKGLKMNKCASNFTYLPFLRTFVPKGVWNLFCQAVSGLIYVSPDAVTV